jgi:SPP1 family predicted phage head-tail adaptor
LLQQIPQVKSPVRRIGALDRRVQIQQRTDTQQTDGTIRTTWSTFATVWADVNVVYGQEIERSLKTFAETQLIVVIRYRSGITVDMQIVFDDHTYDIRGVDDVEGRRTRYMTLWCRELT